MRHSQFSEHDNPFYNDFGSSETICPQNGTCLDGSFNFLCNEDLFKLSSNCKRFKPLLMTRDVRRNLLHTHNGLRNKLSYDMRLAKMNLAYWNVYLQFMAESYLRLCRPYIPDTCLTIGYNGVRVGQNMLFMALNHTAKGLEYWEGRAVRKWYLEIGSGLIKNYKVQMEYFQKQLLEGQIFNFTQLMWPELEFLGCGAAIMFNGLAVVCYYYPHASYNLNISLTEQLDWLKKGETCVCPKERVMCSPNIHKSLWH